MISSAYQRMNVMGGINGKGTYNVVLSDRTQKSCLAWYSVILTTIFYVIEQRSALFFEVIK
jgi:hypothetical protein